MNDTPNNSVIRVPVGNGRFALIDAADADIVLRHHWRTIPGRNGNWYVDAQFKDEYGRPRRLYLHRFILEAPDALDVDHINGDGLDNRRANLRICTKRDNSYNTFSRGGSSRFKGVTFDKQTGRWRVQFTFENKKMSLGRFATQEEAAREYDRAARLAHGEFARLNFPRGDEKSAIRMSDLLDGKDT